jgi:penicillin amidase
VPHLYATTLHDLYFAQGVVHAQDRFWQMDFQRRIGLARLILSLRQADEDQFG